MVIGVHFNVAADDNPVYNPYPSLHDRLQVNLHKSCTETQITAGFQSVQSQFVQCAGPRDEWDSESRSD